MTDESNDHISLPPAVFYLLIGGVFGGGAGLTGFVQPHLEREAVTACYDNSQIAIEVAAQHGEELQILRSLILERTRYRYTSEDAQKRWTEHERSEALQDRRLYSIELHIATEAPHE
jgi:hypothetical protein